MSRQVVTLFLALLVIFSVVRAQRADASSSATASLPVAPHDDLAASAAIGAATNVTSVGTLVANVHCNGIRGHVAIKPTSDPRVARIEARLAGDEKEGYTWQVYTFPVQPGSCTCMKTSLAPLMVDMNSVHGVLPANRDATFDTALPLFGRSSMLMKTLLLRGVRSGLVACATFLPTSTKLSYEAKFMAPVAGKVTVFQTNFGTSYISHLMYSDGQRKHSTHAWNLVQGDEVRDGSPEAQYRHTSTNCRNLNGERLYNDDNKDNPIAVSTELLGLNGRTSFVVENRLLTRATYLVIYSDEDSNVALACAPLSPIRVKTAAAKFSSPEVEGMIMLAQETLYDPTTVNVNLKLGARAYSYGIDQLPKIVRRRSENRKCPNTRGVIYNPYAVDPENVPPQGRGTSDEYAVGDLSGKYGILLDKRDENLRVIDYNLPLFGYFSVVGRAIVIYAPEGDPLGCANVELTGVDMRTAFATFDVPKQGQFIFRQPADDCTADTYIYIEVSQPASHSSRKTVNHPWHVHVNPVDPGNFLSTDSCTAAGPHYNPFNVSTACVYMRDCGPLTSLRCELGDTSSKLGTVDIPPYRPPGQVPAAGAQEPEVGKFFFTDINLPLCGPTAIVGRSVVIHDENYGASRVACSNIIEYKPKREG